MTLVIVIDVEGGNKVVVEQVDILRRIVEAALDTSGCSDNEQFNDFYKLIEIMRDSLARVVWTDKDGRSIGTDSVLTSEERKTVLDLMYSIAYGLEALFRGLESCRVFVTPSKYMVAYYEPGDVLVVFHRVRVEGAGG